MKRELWSLEDLQEVNRAIGDEEAIDNVTLRKFKEPSMLHPLKSTQRVVSYRNLLRLLFGL